MVSLAQRTLVVHEPMNLRLVTALAFSLGVSFGCDAGTRVADDVVDTGNQTGSETLCGNGTLEDSEVCDDGNRRSGDGCSDTCGAMEPGYFCFEAGASCVDFSSKITRDGCHKVYEYDQNGDGQTEAYAVVNFVNESLWSEYLIYVGDDLRLERRYERHGNGDLVSIRSFDRDGNLASVEDYRYDDTLQLERVSLDSNGDGYYDRWEHYVWDEQGQLMSQLSDFHGDDVCDVAEHLTYEGGRIVRDDYDYGCDFNIDAEGFVTYREQRDALYGFLTRREKMNDSKLTYTYADNGELVGYSYRTVGSEVSEESIAVLRDSRGRVVERFQDLNGDGHADRVWHASDWDANRRVTQWSVVSTQGHILFEETLWYLPDGELERKERRDVDGELIQQVVRSFDGLGQVVEELYDYNGNGYADLVWNFEYNADGQLILETKDYTHNPGPDGQPEVRITYSAWNDRGKPILGELDQGNDGWMDQELVLKWDELDRLIEVEHFGQGDDVPDYSEASAVDIEGKVSVREVDYYADGDWDFWEFFDYSDDVVAKYRSDTNGDGIIDYGYDQYLDEAGRLDLYLSDHDGDGYADFRIEGVTTCQTLPTLKARVTD